VRVGETLALFLRDDGALPGWVGIELMAQTVAAWSGYQGHLRQEEPQIGLLLGARKYQCHLARLPAGSLLTIDCEQLLQDGALASFQCYLRCDGELVAEARLSTIQPDAEQLETLLGSRQA
jgi:predicted hotdog family 3-hydroxylacyl-ACP dehydratase